MSDGSSDSDSIRSMTMRRSFESVMDDSPKGKIQGSASSPMSDRILPEAASEQDVSMDPHPSTLSDLLNQLETSQRASQLTLNGATLDKLLSLLKETPEGPEKDRLVIIIGAGMEEQNRVQERRERYLEHIVSRAMPSTSGSSLLPAPSPANLHSEAQLHQLARTPTPTNPGEGSSFQG